MILAIISASLPLVFWWRFKDTPLDRDFVPYAYPAVFKTDYLQDGHADIKPPLIHWSYKVWLDYSSVLKLTLTRQLRLLPALMLSLSVYMVTITMGVTHGLVLSLLLCSPTIWVHMANTEWLTLTLLALSAVSSISPYPYNLVLPVVLGLIPWVNQKNVLLIVPVAWALGLNLVPTFQTVELILAPSFFIMAYLALTKRLELAKTWIWDIPKTFGKNRTFKLNTMSMARLLIPCIVLISPVVACMDWSSRWAVVALVVVLIMLWSKQITPHHFILLALPIALACQPTPLMWLGFAGVWVWRDGLVWWKPGLIYTVTFGMGQIDYAMLLADAKRIEKVIIENTTPEDRIWVNGMENQIYFTTMRKAVRIEIPELQGFPDADLPKFIVHCAVGFKKMEYTGYKVAEISNYGLYTLMEKV